MVEALQRITPAHPRTHPPIQLNWGIDGPTSWKTCSVEASRGLTVFLFLMSGRGNVPPAAQQRQGGLLAVD